MNPDEQYKGSNNIPPNHAGKPLTSMEIVSQPYQQVYAFYAKKVIE